MAVTNDLLSRTSCIDEQRVMLFRKTNSLCDYYCGDNAKGVTTIESLPIRDAVISNHGPEVSVYLSKPCQLGRKHSSGFVGLLSNNFTNFFLKSGRMIMSLGSPIRDLRRVY